MSYIKCPRCTSTNITLLGNNAADSTKIVTGLDLNPLHPLRLTKTKVKKKHSVGKLALGAMTGGTSLLFTGTKKNIKNQYHCQNCGYVWEAKK